MSKKLTNILFILNVIAIGLSIILCCPFGFDIITKQEIIVKNIIIPSLVIVIIVIIAIIRYKYWDQTSKFSIISTYAPVFYVISNMGIFVSICTLRTISGFSSFKNWYLACGIILILALLVATINHLFYGWIQRKNKKINAIIDSVMFIILLGIMAGAYLLENRFVDNNITIKVPFLYSSLFFMIVFIALFHISVLVVIKNSKEVYKSYSQKALVKKWNEVRDIAYLEAEKDVLYNLYYYTKERLKIEDNLMDMPIIDEKIPPQVPKIVEQQTVEIVKEIVEVVDPNELEEYNIVKQKIFTQKEVLNSKKEDLLNKIDELKTEIDSIVLPIKKEKLVINVDKTFVKDIQPSYQDVIKYAESFSDVNVAYNKSGNACRFLLNDLPFAIITDSTRDYRLSFLIDLSDVNKYVTSVANFGKSTTPKGENWFKIINKGDIPETTICELLKGAYEYLLGADEREKKKKEQERLARQQQKEKEKIEAKTANMSDAEKAEFFFKRAAKAEKEAQKAVEDEEKTA